MDENQRLKQVIGLFFLFLQKKFFLLSSYLNYKNCLFHRWRICLALKHMYLNKVSHLSQSPTFAAHLILKTMTVQTHLSSWGKFVKFLKILVFQMKYEIIFRIQSKDICIKPQYLGAIEDIVVVSVEELDQTDKFVLRFSYFSGFSITICTIF